MFSKQRQNGISLRKAHIFLVAGAILIAALMFYSTVRLNLSFHRLTDAAEGQIELRKATRELMDASDYLTEKVQRFTVHGEARFMEEYFTEAFETNRREDAIHRMTEGTDNTAAIQNLKAALNDSMALMSLEYYAMRLVVEAKGYTDYPEQLRTITLSEEDCKLSNAAKLRRATELVLSDEYYAKKDEIRAHMNASLDELERMAYDTDASTLQSFHKEMTLVRLVILIQIVGIFLIVILTAQLGIHPVLNAVEHIKEDSPIPEVGANEFRYLARTYNKMYEVYKSSLARLNFKASHDELTGAYNRSGYELLLSSLDLGSTYMMLFDLDNFKGINDTYGHEMGDRALVKLVEVLKKSFRADDYVCRLGGDEFIVFMVHTDKRKQNLVAAKIREINRALSESRDGIPPLSVSVGIVHGSDAPDAERLFEKVDAAMYRSKQSGKHTYTFGEG